MPHMSNLPWLTLYSICLISLMVFLTKDTWLSWNHRKNAKIQKQQSVQKWIW